MLMKDKYSYHRELDYQRKLKLPTASLVIALDSIVMKIVENHSEAGEIQ